MDNLAYFRRQLNDESTREALPVNDKMTMKDSAQTGDSGPGDNMSSNQGDSVEVTLG